MVFGNSSLQEVKYRFCILRLGLGLNKGLMFGGAPTTHRIFGHSLAWHVHHGR